MILVFILSLPSRNVLNKIEDLLDYGEIVKIPYSQQQVIIKGYTILSAMGVFKDYISSWNHRPVMECNWVNFKDHFHLAQSELEKTQELSLQDT